MNDTASPRSARDGLAGALGGAGVHGLSWLILLTWQLVFMRLVLQVAEDLEVELPPFARPLHVISRRVIDTPIIVLILLLLAFLGVDVWLLRGLGRSPLRRGLRELWSGLVVLTPLVLVALWSVACMLPFMKRAVEAGKMADELAAVAREDLQAMAGEWSAVRTRQAAGQAPATDLLSIRLTGHSRAAFTWTTNGQTATGDLFLSVRPNPERIHLVHATGPDQGAEQSGIYELRDGKLAICLAPVGTRKDDIPKEFTKRQDNSTLYIFERPAAPAAQRGQE